MIKANEIKEKAREYGVPVSTIERDYAQSWMLKALRDIDMALKGGTGIKKVYVENYRFSDDLDFTLLHPVSTTRLKSQIRKAVIMARDESGINFNSRVRFEDTESGLRANVYFTIIRISAGTETKIKLDITYPERESILLPVVKKQIFYPYSDKFDATINAYALEEIIAEKLRTLFERVRPRDLYDIWYFKSYLSKEIVIKTFVKKCESKNITADISIVEGNREKFKNSWEQSLHHQFKTIPDFEKVYNEVLQHLKKII